MEKRVVGCIGLVVAVILFCFGIFTKVPPREISFYDFDENGYEEYVGGDAYNIQIEASLRGGEIAGAKAAKAVYISCSAIVLLLSLPLIEQSQRDMTSLTSSVNIQNNDLVREMDTPVS